ncbi:hypothetical protein K440DRAFT_616151, partial [Wilcoxina mikolae CBS 423.85]
MQSSCGTSLYIARTLPSPDSSFGSDSTTTSTHLTASPPRAPAPSSSPQRSTSFHRRFQPHHYRRFQSVHATAMQSIRQLSGPNISEYHIYFRGRTNDGIPCERRSGRQEQQQAPWGTGGEAGEEEVQLAGVNWPASSNHLAGVNWSSSTNHPIHLSTSWNVPHCGGSCGRSCGSCGMPCGLRDDVRNDDMLHVVAERQNSFFCCRYGRPDPGDSRDGRWLLRSSQSKGYLGDPNRICRFCHSKEALRRLHGH